MSSGERTGWFFLLIPLVGFVGAVVVTNAFHPRYFIGMLPGVAVAFAAAIYRIFQHDRRISVAVFIILISFGSYNLSRSVRHPELITASSMSYQPEVREVLGQEDRIWNDGKRFVLLPDLLVLPMRYYSHHPERYMRLPPVTPDYGNAVIPTWTHEAVLEHAREIAFVDPEPELLSELGKANVNLRVRQIGPVTLVYAN